MNMVRNKKTTIPGLLFLVSLTLILSLIPSPGAAVANGSQQEFVLPATLDLAVTNVSAENGTVPEEYRITPTLVDVRVGVSETSLPGPKGEMASGPRTIGFSATPATIVVLIAALAAGAGGAWYVLRRKTGEETEE
jgi:hypothetical protein